MKFNFIKKAFLLVVLFFAGISEFFSLDSAFSLYDELCFAYNSQFYPGACQYASLIEENYSESEFLPKALLIKGESLYHLGKIEEAEFTLQKAKKYLVHNRDLYAECNYWLAKVCDRALENTNALTFYFEYLASSYKKYYNDSILSAGFVFYRTKDYKNSIPLFEYVIQNGNFYSSDSYSSCLIKLCDSYNKTSQSEKTIYLYNSLKKDDFDKAGISDELYLLFKEYSADAFLLNGEYKKAYDFYIEILQSGNKNLASNALKKAYLVSQNHKKEVGEDPGEVLKDAQKYLAENPSLLGEFWTRLASDAYEQGDYKKSLSYFDQAEKNAPVELFLYASLYRAQIACGKNPDFESAERAEKMILKSRSILNDENSHILFRESYILLTQFAAVQKNWEKVKEYGKNVYPLDEDTRYFLALADYYTKDYGSAKTFLRNSNSNLQALNYARSGDLNNAAFVFQNILENRPLTEEERLNYAKVLLTSGRYREAQIESAKSKLVEAKYILALAQFNTWSWPYAEESFNFYIKNTPKNEKYYQYALFYLGYCQYRQGKTEEALKNLTLFAQANPEHELIYNAYIALSNCASQLSLNEKAIFWAEKAVSKACEENKSDAILLCSEVYLDAKKYSSVIEILTPYQNRKDDFGCQSVYKIAQAFEKSGDLKNADLKYYEVYSRFPSTKLAEEAMYRRAEIYFNAENYSDALKNFEEYSKKFTQGSFVDASWYFSAECLEKTGNKERAILQNLALIKKFEKSTYVYSASKNLIELYRTSGQYQNALEWAEYLEKNYAEQAKLDGLDKEVVSLKKLLSGKTEAIVQKEKEYSSLGAENTVSGRNSGTELVLLYYQSSYFYNDAVKLSEKLFDKQKNNLKEESLNAAKTGEILAKDFRKQEKNKKSAETFLLCAEYYRSNKNDDKAASCLYGAYEAFIAEGLIQDANESAKLLKQLYPESRYAKNAKIKM